MKRYRYKSRVLSLWYEDGNGRETTISIKHTFCKDILNWMRKKKKRSDRANILNGRLSFESRPANGVPLPHSSYHFLVAYLQATTSHSTASHFYFAKTVLHLSRWI